MSRFNLFQKLTALMARNGPDAMLRNIAAPPTRKQLKRMRPPRWKPAFSMGFRGATKTYSRPGGMPAPTIDQVRNRERKYGHRIHVKNGLMFFADDGSMWTKELANQRNKEKACGTV